jgi:hypothetical protein
MANPWLRGDCTSRRRASECAPATILAPPATRIAPQSSPTTNTPRARTDLRNDGQPGTIDAVEPDLPSQFAAGNPHAALKMLVPAVQFRAGPPGSEPLQRTPMRTSASQPPRSPPGNTRGWWRCPRGTGSSFDFPTAQGRCSTRRRRERCKWVNGSRSSPEQPGRATDPVGRPRANRQAGPWPGPRSVRFRTDVVRAMADTAMETRRVRFRA